ncbi:MAG: hypothetical protein ABIH46_05695 [Chloroflexota bacterium]
MELVFGRHYRCRNCKLVYCRGNSRNPWASCGHPAARQEEVSERTYKQYRARIEKGGLR